MRIIIIALLGVLPFLNCAEKTTAAAPSLASFISFTDTDSTLYNVEQKVENALAVAILTKSSSSLDEIEAKLKKLGESNNKNRVIEYWKAYVNYYQGVFYFLNKDTKNSQNALGNGIKLLEAVDNKNSEEYALLSMLTSFSMGSANSFDIPVLATKVKKNNSAAMKLDANNPRAYYAAAMNDFYTPAKFNGGQLVEKYTKKAISLPDQASPNPYLPSWGKKMSYELLIRYYIRENKIEEAKTTYKEAKKLYPQDYQLIQLGAELMAKE